MTLSVHPSSSDICRVSYLQTVKTMLRNNRAWHLWKEGHPNYCEQFTQNGVVEINWLCQLISAFVENGIASKTVFHYQGSHFARLQLRKQQNYQKATLLNSKIAFVQLNMSHYAYKVIGIAYGKCGAFSAFSLLKYQQQPNITRNRESHLVMEITSIDTQISTSMRTKSILYSVVITNAMMCA